jgi:hypothetical protein
MQQIGEIVQRVFRSLVFSLGAQLIFWPRHLVVPHAPYCQNQGSDNQISLRRMNHGVIGGL